jgi:hypothetical protein
MLTPSILMEMRSPEENTAVLTVSEHVVAGSAMVHVTEVATPFFLTVKTHEFPLPGAAITRAWNRCNVPAAGKGVCETDSVELKAPNNGT